MCAGSSGFRQLVINLSKSLDFRKSKNVQGPRKSSRISQEAHRKRVLKYWDCSSSPKGGLDYLEWVENLHIRGLEEGVPYMGPPSCSRAPSVSVPLQKRPSRETRISFAEIKTEAKIHTNGLVRVGLVRTSIFD